MKLNKIMMVLAATAIVGCTSEDLNELTSKQAPEDSRLIELNENFVLAGVGAEGNITRTHWDQDAETKGLVNKFLPIYTSSATFTSTLDADADLYKQAVGLCWVGPDDVGTDVYTNYQFYHFGWLNKDEAEADLDKCGTLYNGSLYSDITMTTGTADEEAVPGTDWGVAGLKPKSVKDGEDNLNYNSGVYKTENKAIFRGQYIVYYPFNPDFKETGTIPAIAKTSFEWEAGVDDYDSPELGEATFRYSAPVNIEGGDQAANFGLYNLSTLVRLRVSSVTGDANIGDDIDQIVLYSGSRELLKQANLAADKIKAGNTGAELYASTEGTSTITTTFTGILPTLDVKKNTEVSAYITVLPTTVDDLVAFVHNATDGTWSIVGIPATEFKAGNAQVLDITVTEDNILSDFIATDGNSLKQALLDAEAVATEDEPQSIYVLGDITLESDLVIEEDEDRYITITGGDIIVPQDVTLTLTSLKEMKSEIRVLGKSCCDGIQGGRLVVTGVDADKDATILNYVTLEPTEARVANDTEYDTYNPEVTYQGAADITIAEGGFVNVKAGNVTVEKPVQHKGDINTYENAKVTVKAGGDLNFMGGSVYNSGIIEVMKDGKFDMTASDGGATALDGERMTNYGKFIHNVDAQVGTAVQQMNQYGEYRCKVDEQIKLDNAFKWWTACSVIEMVNTSDVSYNLGTYGDASTLEIKHNGKYIDFEVNSGSAVTTFSNPKIAGATKGDDKIIKIGNLTVTTGGLDINYSTGTGKNNIGRRTLTVNGDMTVKAATNINTSKKVNVTGNLAVDGTEVPGLALTYKGGKFDGTLNNFEGFAVTGDITVKAAAFNAPGTTTTDVDALNISCANFYLTDKATAVFGNTTDGGAKNMTVKGIISNPKGCTFHIVKANQDGNNSVLANVTCYELIVGGTFSAARPQVVPAK